MHGINAGSRTSTYHARDATERLGQFFGRSSNVRGDVGDGGVDVLLRRDTRVNDRHGKAACRLGKTHNDSPNKPPTANDGEPLSRDRL